MKHKTFGKEDQKVRHSSHINVLAKPNPAMTIPSPGDPCRMDATKGELSLRAQEF